jgi:fibronectin type 3 domain-containing protein
LILNIEFPEGAATEFVIYRATGEDALTIYKVIDTASSYKDSNYKKGATYQYAVIARGADGRESKQSEVLVIKK